MSTALLAKLVFLGLVASIVFGDASLAAVIAGSFSVINTVLVGVLIRRQGRTEQAVQRTQDIIAAPRRAVYNAAGEIIGTVLELEQEPNRVFAPQRATDTHHGERPTGL